MPVLPVPSGRNATRVAALVIVFFVVVMLSPAILLYSLLPRGRTFLFQLLAELRAWIQAVISPDDTSQQKKELPAVKTSTHELP